MSLKKLAFISVLISILFTSCITHTMVTINSEPEEVDVIVDGKPLGKTPVSVSLSNKAWEEHSIVARKDGYNIYSSTLAGEPKIFNIVSGSIFFLTPFPLIWAYGPRANQFIIMTEKK